jgi:hypothetical protein
MRVIHNCVDGFLPAPQIVDSLVELSGIEPLTSSLRTRRSPS